jgi:hypothetical protein
MPALSYWVTKGEMHKCLDRVNCYTTREVMDVAERWIRRSNSEHIEVPVLVYTAGSEVIVGKWTLDDFIETIVEEVVSEYVGSRVDDRLRFSIERDLLRAYGYRLEVKVVLVNQHRLEVVVGRRQFALDLHGMTMEEFL